MQITSTMRHTPHPQALERPQPGDTKVSSQAVTDTIQPESGFMKNVGTYGMHNGVRWGNGVGAVSSYLGGAALGSAGLYAGVVGGSAAGVAVGLGVAPAIAAVGSSGALDFVRTTFSTTGTLIQAGMVLGGAAVALGAWEVGSSLGKAAGTPVGFVIGGPIGLTEGAWKQMQGHPMPVVTHGAPSKAPEVNAFDLNEFKGISAVPVGVLGAVGAASGGLGGAVLGGAVVSGATLLEMALAQNVTLSALSGPAMMGAMVGGGVGLLLGARGGFRMGKAVNRFAAAVTDKLTRKPATGGQPATEGELAKVGKNAAGNALNFASKLSPYQVGFNVADIGMAGTLALSNNPQVPLLGNVMGSIHGAMAAANLMGAIDGPTAYRCTKAAGHGLLAAGNLVGAHGGGSWSLPLIAAGLLLNTVNDYRAEN
jgi:hypothetical protein